MFFFKYYLYFNFLKFARISPDLNIIFKEIALIGKFFS